MMIRTRLAFVPALLALLIWSPRAGATWSIVLADTETREVAVGTVTCLNNFDLMAIVPVVVVEKGAAAVQASGDFDGVRRPIIFDGFINGDSIEDIFDELEQIGGHQSRQYGIVNTMGESLTFTGSSTFQWAGGVIGQQGAMVYAIQGNILAGDCVVPAIEEAILETEGDFAAKLMAGMVAARDTGGDGRCSCSPNNPTGCGCPPDDFEKSGHIGGMIVARVGDTDDTVCNAGGCADGDYFMDFNVPFQGDNEPDPVDQLLEQFTEWRTKLDGRPDAVQSEVEFNPPSIPPNGFSSTFMLITLRDWEGDTVLDAADVTVEHTSDSAGLSTIGNVIDLGKGQYAVELTAAESTGIDRFRIVADDGVRPISLMPDPTLEYFNLLRADVVYGDLVQGALDDLNRSDDSSLQTRSDRGFLASEPNLTEVVIDVINETPLPDTVDVAIESRINHPEGLARLRFFNWGEMSFEQVGQYVITSTEETEILSGIDASGFVQDSADADLRMSITHTVVAVFAAKGFDSFFDHLDVSFE